MNLNSNVAAELSSQSPSLGLDKPQACLLVEDCKFDRKRILRALSAIESDIDIVEATSISEAREKLSERKFDLIMLDNSLPDGLGLILVQEVHQTAKFADLPVIMVSGDDSEALAKAALDTGCTDFLTKDDLDPIRLSDAITGAILKGQQREIPSQVETTSQTTALSQHRLRENVIELNASVLRISRLAKKLQKDQNKVSPEDKRVIAAEIQMVSDDLHRKLNAMLAETV